MGILGVLGLVITYAICFALHKTGIVVHPAYLCFIAVMGGYISGVFVGRNK